MADDSVSLGIVLLKIVGFFAFSGIIGLIFYKIYKKWVDEAEKELHRHTIIAFVFCLIMAFVAEEVFGVADITGAYIAGLIISMYSVLLIWSLNLIQCLICFFHRCSLQASD